MNLYEINMEIEKCMAEATDPVTGEIIGDYLDTEKLEALEMDKAKKVESIAKWVKNLKAEAEAIKTEKLKLADRQKRAENKIGYLEAYLEDSLKGEKFKSEDGTVDIRYRTSRSVKCIGKSEDEVILSLIEEGRLDLLTQKAPTLNKTAIKNAIIKDGEFFEGLDVIETRNMQIN